MSSISNYRQVDHNIHASNSIEMAEPTAHNVEGFKVILKDYNGKGKDTVIMQPAPGGPGTLAAGEIFVFKSKISNEFYVSEDHKHALAAVFSQAHEIRLESNNGVSILKHVNINVVESNKFSVLLNNYMNIIQQQNKTIEDAKKKELSADSSSLKNRVSEQPKAETPGPVLKAIADASRGSKKLSHERLIETIKKAVRKEKAEGVERTEAHAHKVELSVEENAQIGKTENAQARKEIDTALDVASQVSPAA